MTKERYIALMAWSRRTPRRVCWLKTACRVLPITVGGIYVAVGLWLFFVQPSALVLYAAAPALTFGIVTAVRHGWNCPRPYELWSDMTPLVCSRHRGQSFPSRHSAAAMALAMAGWGVHPALGGVLTVLALGVGATRVLVGVHRLRDVVAGYTIAAVIGAVALGFVGLS